MLRPFPAAGLRAALRGVKAVLIGERADSYGAHGGNLAHEVKSALKDDPDNRTLCLNRIYGLGGRDFYAEDADALFRLAIDAAEAGRVEVPFDYYGVVPEVRTGPRAGVCLRSRPRRRAPDGLIKVEPGRGRPPAGRHAAGLASRRPAEGGRAGSQRLPRLRCVPRALNQFFNGLEGDVVVLYQTGCAMVVSTGYPVHVAPHHLRSQPVPERRGDAVGPRRDVPRAAFAAASFPPGDDITFVMVTRRRRHGHRHGRRDRRRDPEPRVHRPRVRQPGVHEHGRAAELLDAARHMHLDEQRRPRQPASRFHHKDMPQIMAATNIPYVFTGVEGFPDDLVAKARRRSGTRNTRAWRTARC